ncbi:acetolactate synthase-1/2/3 large subunit [Colwellia chukchiensis]|uniref:Acetolactate synthase-1/2/3 large subunit n=1 Tax=Colwellia chukchiensis TaxID=641665 RepID=A0A1H7G992_9GAMM|nr:5-guanidino-2-oxopentanoate decarboxylase [Colwellia chukchiensis]SEK34691.1 acetolactate synthase-1/2/3 large subunit [Colwellia chukchiensis]
MATCGEVLVNILENYGVDTVFGIPGFHTIELYRGLPNSNITHITPRHEQGAGFMADGYARVTGKAGVCFIITGPGMTNIATAMGQAMQDSVPMLVISSVNRTEHLGMGEGRLHELPDQSALLKQVSVFSHRVTHVEQLPKVLARAFTVFSSARPGPVHIELPIDVITAQADQLDIDAFAITPAPAPAPSAVTEAVALLSAAKRPLIVVGGGAANASAEVVALAEKVNAPVINTVNGKGIMPISHPLAVGCSGSCAIIRQEMKEADVVLAVGTEFSETDYDFFLVGEIEMNGKLIRIDIDGDQLSRNVKPSLAILSDASFALAAINTALVIEHPLQDGKQRAKQLQEIARSVTTNAKYDDFFATIKQALPEVVIVGDSTQPVYYALTHYETDAPRRYFHSASGFGTLGYAIPAAIGAKLGQANSPVVALIGDGAAQFTIGELASAVEAELSVTFLIWNNQGYGEISHFMDDAKIARIGVDIYTPDFMKIADGFGCATARARNHEELQAALIAANKLSGPSVIEVMEDDFVDGYPY